MNPKVSIIIPAYNAERFVNRCMESILRQQYESFEVIVVDDGSKDNTGIMLDEFARKDSRIKVIHKANGGVSTARNEGLNIAQGDWVTFIDIDDMISAEFLCEEDFMPFADLIVKSWKYTDGTTANENINEGLFIEGELVSFLSMTLYYNVFRTPWAKLFRRNIIEQLSLRFNPKYRLGEDNLFVLTYLKQVKSINVSRLGYYLYEKATSGKYPLKFQNAFEYVREFKSVYSELGVNCPLLVKKILIWYSSFTVDFTLQNKIKWYTDKTINAMYRESFVLFPLAKKLKICIYSIISFLRFK